MGEVMIFWMESWIYPMDIIKKKKKSGKIMNENIDSKEILFEDDSIRISYFGHPSNKKPSTYLDLTFITENLSSSTIKSIKLSLSKSSSFKPKEKDKSSYSLAKKLASSAENKQIIKMKCNKYSGNNEGIKCKISYNDFKSNSLSIKLATHCFITNESIDDDVNDEQSLMKIVEDKEKCPFKTSERLKLPKNISCGDALDQLVKIWRVNNITMTDKKSTYYAKLMLNKHLAIYVKTNKKKNAIEITLSGSQQEFIEAMINEFKSILLN